jgi:hypothetical protein
MGGGGEHPLGSGLRLEGLGDREGHPVVEGIQLIGNGLDAFDPSAKDERRGLTCLLQGIVDIQLQRATAGPGRLGPGQGAEDEQHREEETPEHGAQSSARRAHGQQPLQDKNHGQDAEHHPGLNAEEPGKRRPFKWGWTW